MSHEYEFIWLQCWYLEISFNNSKTTKFRRKNIWDVKESDMNWTSVVKDQNESWAPMTKGGCRRRSRWQIPVSSPASSAASGQWARISLHWWLFSQMTMNLNFCILSICLQQIFKMKHLPTWFLDKNSSKCITLDQRIIRIEPNIMIFTFAKLVNQLFERNDMVLFHLGVIFVCAGMYQEVARRVGSKKERKNFKDFEDAIYYAVVVHFTVGFGDVSPESKWMRRITMAQILTAFILMNI